MCFRKKNFIYFSGLWLENVRISSVSFRQLWQNCIYVSIGMFWGKQMISERDVFFREFFWSFLDFRWIFFRRFVKTTIRVSVGKLGESNFWRNIFSQFQIFWAFCGGLSSTASCVSGVKFWEKWTLLLETRNFLSLFRLWSKKFLFYFSKAIGKLRSIMC